MSSSYVSFDLVKRSVGIVQILDHYGLTATLERKGDGFVGPCPFHAGTSPSFRVSPDKNCFNCFAPHCKAHGNVLDFVSRRECVTIPKAAKLIHAWFKLESSSGGKVSDNRSGKPTASTPEASEPNPPLTFALKNLDPSHASLADHGLTPEAVSEFGIGFCGKGLMAGRIAVPIHNGKGELVGYAGRTVDKVVELFKAWKFPPKFRPSLDLFNLHRAIREPTEKPLIIVRDILAAVVLFQFGLRKVVATMYGPLSPAQEALFTGLAGVANKTVIVSNEDEDGRRERMDVAERLVTKVFVHVVRFEEEGFKLTSITSDTVGKLKIPG